jgi:hypothetical protein
LYLHPFPLQIAPISIADVSVVPTACVAFLLLFLYHTTRVTRKRLHCLQKSISRQLSRQSIYLYIILCQCHT